MKTNSPVLRNNRHSNLLANRHNQILEPKVPPLYLECSWCIIHDNVKFAYEMTDSVCQLDYSNEIVGEIRVGDEITAIYADNGCGDQFWMILNNKNRIYQDA